MVKLGKLTDYGLVLMTCIARSEASLPQRTARDLAVESRLPLSTVSKLLKELLQSGLLISHRGTKGGYMLAREPHQISVIEIIAAIEGPMALTECSTDVSGLCNLELSCPIKSNQRIINQAVRGVLEKITLSDLVQPLQLTTIKDARGRLVPHDRIRENPMSSNTDTIRELAQQEYKWGFVTDINEDRAPKGLNEDIIRFISAKKNEPEFMLQWRLKAYRHWVTLEAIRRRAEVGEHQVPADRLPGHRLLLRAQAEAEPEEPRRTRSGNSPHLREARHSARGTENARGRRRGRRVRQRFGGHHLQGEAWPKRA